MQTKEEILAEKLRVHGYNLHNILHTKGMMNDMLTIAVDAMEEYHTQFDAEKEEFDVVVKPDFKTTTIKATVTSVQDAADINDFVSTEKNFNAELNRAVRSFLPLPTHRQIEIWTSMGYVGTWEHNSAENNKPFFNWIIENKKQVDFISAVKNYQLLHSKTTSNQ
jgi:hypothetical protein